MPSDFERQLRRFAEMLDREAPTITIHEILDRAAPRSGLNGRARAVPDAADGGVPIELIEFPRIDEFPPSCRRPLLTLALAAAAVVGLVIGVAAVVRTGDDIEPTDIPASTIPTSTIPATTIPATTLPAFREVGTVSGLRSPRYSADSSLLAIESAEGQVLVHDAASLTELRELPCPTRIEPLPESAGTAPGVDRVWDVDAASRWSSADLTLLMSASREMCGITVRRDGTRAVADADLDGRFDGEWFGRSSLWDTTDGSLIAVIPGRSNGFTADGSTLIMSDGPSFSVVDASTGSVMDTVADNAGLAILSPDGSRLLRWGNTLGDIDASAPAKIYDSRTLVPLTTLSVGPPSEVDAIEDPVFDRANRRVAALTGAGATIWDASTGDVLLRIPIDLVSGRSIYFSSDGAVVAVRNGTHILVFDSTTGTRVIDLDLGDAIVEELVFSADGRGLAAGITGGARIWNMLGGTAVESAKLSGAQSGSTTSAPSLPAPVDMFVGRWVSTDTDGSSQAMEIARSGDDEYDVSIRDAAATTACGGAASTMVGVARLATETSLVIAEPALTCDDGTIPPIGPAPQAELADFTLGVDTTTGRLVDTLDVVWHR